MAIGVVGVLLPLIVPAPGLRHLVLGVVITAAGPGICVSGQISGTVLADYSALSSRHFQAIIRFIHCELLIVNADAPANRIDFAVAPTVILVMLRASMRRGIQILSHPAQTIQFIVGIVLLMHRVTADLIVVRNRVLLDIEIAIGISSRSTSESKFESE